LKARGVEFLRAPETYYEALIENLKKSKVKIAENMDVVSIKRLI
jgi:hypothetical protein